VTLRETTSPARGNGRSGGDRGLNTRAGRVDRPDVSEPGIVAAGRHAVIRRRLAVPALTAAWLLVAAGGLALTRGHSAPPGRPVPAVVLLGMFVATQALVVNVQLRREARSVFLSEVPLFLALMSLAPLALVLTRVAGALVGFGVLRRQYRRPEKLVFNLALAAAEVAVAVAVFDAITPSTQETAAGAPQLTWLAATLAAAVSSSFAAVGVALVIDLLEGAVRVRALGRLATEAAVATLPVTALGVVAWAAWEQSAWVAVPLAAVTAVILLGYRAYARLRERHLALERLYRFSQVAFRAPGVDGVLQGVLQHAREILHAERARVVFVPEGGAEGVEVVLDGSERLRQGAAQAISDGDDPAAGVVGEGRPVLVPRGTRDPRERGWLERHRLRDSIMVPLHGEGGVIGLLAVDDRLGDARGFEPDDVRVLETVANQAAVALRNGELVDKLRHEALHDPLTGLPNRALLQREIEARLESAGTAGFAGFAVGILDLDAFKDVNDTLGHAHGDRLLAEVAERLVAALTPRAFVARLGGDEFAVVADGCGDPEAALRLGRRLQAALEAPVLLSGIEVDVSGSFGVALAPRHGSTPGALLKRADQAMYDAKGSGRAVRVFEEALDTTSPGKLALVAELRQAIAHGEVEVHVQPKVRAGDGQLCGTEALARWSTPARGPVSPTDFVALAERSGLIHPLTRLVLDQAAAACAGWQHLAPGVGVSVNVSARSLGDDGIVRLVDRMLRKHRLPATLLTLEITESHIMASPDVTLDVLLALRRRGVGLSVDDFGTGYSSLSYLRRLPVDEVKVDRSFVHRMVQDRDDEAIVRSVVQLARELGLRVVAEGVEDEPTWHALAALGVDEIQGWVTAKAMPPAEFECWAAARAAEAPDAAPAADNAGDQPAAASSAAARSAGRDHIGQ
jgi:diguanylate cyclase (GGDEF)-like protein